MPVEYSEGYKEQAKKNLERIEKTLLDAGYTREWLDNYYELWKQSAVPAHLA